MAHNLNNPFAHLPAPLPPPLPFAGPPLVFPIWAGPANPVPANPGPGPSVNPRGGKKKIKPVKGTTLKKIKKILRGGLLSVKREEELVQNINYITQDIDDLNNPGSRFYQSVFQNADYYKTSHINIKNKQLEQLQKQKEALVKELNEGRNQNNQLQKYIRESREAFALKEKTKEEACCGF